MRIEVRMHGLLRLLVSEAGGCRDVDMTAGSDVAALLREMGAEKMTWLVAVNGHAASQRALLQEGDRVDVYPSLEGG